MFCYIAIRQKRIDFLQIKPMSKIRSVVGLINKIFLGTIII